MMGRYKKTKWSAFTSGPSLINQNLNYEKIYVFQQQIYNFIIFPQSRIFNIYHRCMSMTWFEYHKSTDLLFCQKESHMGEYRFNLCNTDFHIIISF